MGGISFIPTAAQIGAVPTSRLVNAGTNMSGGGNLGADITLNAIGGGGGGTIDIEDEGSLILAASTLNFTGAGVTATDLGGGVAGIAIPGGGGSGATVLGYGFGNTSSGAIDISGGAVVPGLTTTFSLAGAKDVLVTMGVIFTRTGVDGNARFTMRINGTAYGAGQAPYGAYEGEANAYWASFSWIANLSAGSNTIDILASDALHVYPTTFYNRCLNVLQLN